MSSNADGSSRRGVGTRLLAAAAPNAASRSAAFPGRNGESSSRGCSAPTGTTTSTSSARTERGCDASRGGRGSSDTRRGRPTASGSPTSAIEPSLATRAYEIYVVRPNGTGFRRVTHDRWIDDQVAWSPDGRRLVFESSRLSGRFGIWVMTADGGGAVRLTRDGAIPVWAPDGSAIAFIRAPKGYDQVWLMNPDGRDQRQLTTPPSMGDDHAQDSMPAWSPGGDELLFTRRYRGRTDIYVVRADGTDLRRLTKEAGLHSWPAWSPDASASSSFAPCENRLRSTSWMRTAVTKGE